MLSKVNIIIVQQDTVSETCGHHFEGAHKTRGHRIGTVRAINTDDIPQLNTIKHAMMNAIMIKFIMIGQTPHQTRSTTQQTTTIGCSVSLANMLMSA